MFAARGVEFQRPYRLNDLAWLEVVAGNLDAAVELTDDALEAAPTRATPGCGVVELPRRPRLRPPRPSASPEARRRLRVWADEHDQPPRR